MTCAEAVHLIGFAYVIGTILIDITNDEHRSFVATLFARLHGNAFADR
jgi:hypothetical protein